MTASHPLDARPDQRMPAQDTFVPAVSVLMPVYNAEQYLATALESVCAQSIRDWELVLVDDGSTDSSPAIMNRFAAQDSRVIVIRQSNGGIVAALNAGLQACRADLVARMDADDLCHPNRLAEQRGFLHAHPAIAAVGTAFRLIDGEGRPGPVLQQPTSHEAIIQTLRGGNCLAHPTVMMSKGAVIEVGGYREPLRHAEDYDLWTRLADKHRLANLSACLLDYRVHQGQVSWEQAELQTIRTLGVKVLWAERQASQTDSVSAGHPVDRALLARHGLSSRHVDEAIIAAVASRVALCESAGMREGADRIRQELLTQVDKTDLKKIALADLAWADFIATQRTRRWGHAGLALVRCAAAVAADPTMMRKACGKLLLRLPARLLTGIRTIGGRKP